MKLFILGLFLYNIDKINYFMFLKNIIEMIVDILVWGSVSS